MNKFNVAVVGGGIFGITTAVTLSEDGHRVSLFEQQQDILQAASGINQYRLHRGYHYPRSVDTALAAKLSEEGFRKQYPGCVIDDFDHYYAIARSGSLTTPDEFERFCATVGLELESGGPPVLKEEAVAGCWRVRESLFDVDLLRDACRRQLVTTGVSVKLGRRVRRSDLEDFDVIIIATYARSNELLDPPFQRRYQFEVCEKIVVRPSAKAAGTSIVVMDGPFTCIDPLGTTGKSLMGHVVHAIHHSNVGLLPEIPAHLDAMLNRGTIADPPFTKAPEFLSAGAEFFDGLDEFRHVGSMFTIRTVIPNLEHSDARPTLVQNLGDRVLALFSGKIGTCVQAAEEVRDILSEQTPAGRLELEG